MTNVTFSVRYINITKHSYIISASMQGQSTINLEVHEHFDRGLDTISIIIIFNKKINIFIHSTSPVYLHRQTTTSEETSYGLRHRVRIILHLAVSVKFGKMNISGVNIV